MPIIKKFGSWTFCVVATIVSAFLMFGQNCSFHPAYRAPVEIASPWANVAVPITAEVGELVQLEAHGTSVVWFSEPTVKMVTYGANNENCVVAFKKAGAYLVFSAAITEDVTVSISRIAITVAGGAPPAVVVEPDKPVNPSLSRLAAFAGPNKAAVAASFRSIAAQLQTKLDTGVLVTPPQIVAITAESNRRAVAGQETQWQAFFAELESYLSTDVPKTIADHIRVWNAIAAALEK